jgi:hypothetical protein
MNERYATLVYDNSLSPTSYLLTRKWMDACIWIEDPYSTFIPPPHPSTWASVAAAAAGGGDTSSHFASHSTIARKWGAAIAPSFSNLPTPYCRSGWGSCRCRSQGEARRGIWEWWDEPACQVRRSASWWASEADWSTRRRTHFGSVFAAVSCFHGCLPCKQVSK